jgi:hypothetical protein
VPCGSVGGARAWPTARSSILRNAFSIWTARGRPACPMPRSRWPKRAIRHPSIRPSRFSFATRRMRRRSQGQLARLLSRPRRAREPGDGNAGHRPLHDDCSIPRDLRSRGRRLHHRVGRHRPLTARAVTAEEASPRRSDGCRIFASDPRTS